MKKLTGQEVLTILEENFGENVSDFAYCEYTELIPDDFKFSDELQKKIDVNQAAYDAYVNHPDYSSRTASPELEELRRTWLKTPNEGDVMAEEYFQSLGLGEVVEIEQYGGEDMGSTWYSIKHFVDHDVYIRTDGYYQSYNGTDFYEGIGKVVTPKQKTVTVFE